ncbi:helicase-related protein [Embleya sp. NPDC005575]|uniref:helicase-related protein n=1 Tax=Embleya sp. NPDC005575 TaxID=3156892 RepID=UPI0033A86887
MSGYAPGTLVAARGRDWVVLPGSSAEFLKLRPLGGDDETVAGIFPEYETVTAATFPPPTSADLGSAVSAGLLRTALRVGFRASAGPLRSLAGISVEPRHYQLVPLLLAMRQETVRLLIADDVGIGKTIETGLIAAEMLAQGETEGLAVLCSPALAEQWQAELRDKFGIEAELVLPSTVNRLARDVPFGESLFTRYKNVVISTDYIKSETRREHFVKHAPDLIIVDEAHTCVGDGGGMGDKAQKQLRYELLRKLAAREDRHLILVTATPHSGKEHSFRNLIGLLDPTLADVDLESSKGRDRLARHMVQRRRPDIRKFLDEETPFPKERETQEVAYRLTPEYAAFRDSVLEYARESVLTDEGELRKRVRWWSALALLRAVASSPRAAAETLERRASVAGAEDLAEAETLGRQSVLDLSDDEALEGIDVTPGGDADVPQSERARLRALAAQAKALEGKPDAKLALVLKRVKALLMEGYDPIVFCRFIDTAEYVAEYLYKGLGGKAEVKAVTGVLPPVERIKRIEELTDKEGRRVLVATDCLSEGVNLQEHFQAVVHYDLAWNPTRHEQREGRVDRFGQRYDIVRAITVYGQDNGIDGIVLDVLIRKYQAIRKTTGVLVAVPQKGEGIVRALLDGLLLKSDDKAQLELALDLTAQVDELHREWHKASERESKQLTKFAHSGVQLDEVREELNEIRAALGSHADVEGFVRDVLTALGAGVTPTSDGLETATGQLPLGLRHALGAGGAGDKPKDVTFRRVPPGKRSEGVLIRTDPKVSAIAEHVLDTALEPSLPGRDRPASRCGVVRTWGVETRTTLLLVRYRFHVTLPARRGGKPPSMVAEDARLMAFRGSPSAPEWLSEEDAARLLDVSVDGNVDPPKVHIERVLAALPAIQPTLDERGDALALRLKESHQRVRTAVGAIRRGLDVVHQPHADVLGLYIYLPMTQTGGVQ